MPVFDQGARRLSDGALRRLAIESHLQAKCESTPDGLTLPASVSAFLLGDGPDIASNSPDIATAVLDIAASIVPHTAIKSYSVRRRRKLMCLESESAQVAADGVLCIAAPRYQGCLSAGFFTQTPMPT